MFKVGDIVTATLTGQIVKAELLNDGRVQYHVQMRLEADDYSSHCWAYEQSLTKTENT